MNFLLFKEILGGIAVVLGLLGYAIYIRGIVQGKVKPHAFSWSIWGLLTAIAFAAQITDGGGPGTWVTGVTALCSFGFAAVGLTASARIYIAKSDWIYFTLTLFTIPLWYFTGNPFWSVIIVTIIDAVAFIPTFRKAYYNPETENGFSYMLAGLKFLISLFALGNFTVVTALYPTSIVFTDFVFVLMLIWRKSKDKKSLTSDNK